MIGVCEEAILVTDLDTRTTKAISVFVQKGGILFPTEVFFASDSDDFGLLEGKNGIFVHDGAARTDPGSRTQIFELQRRDVEACVHPDTPRKSIKCSSPATRQDGQYVAHANHALTVTNRGGQSVIDWSSHSQDWRVDRATAFPSAPCGPPPPSSGAKEWSEKEAADTFRAYTSIRSGGGRVTAYLTCICSASGCKKTELAGFLDEPFAFRDDGTILTESTNPTMTETVITLRRPQKPNVQKKIAERCLSGRFGPGGRVFMLCEANERSTVYELGAADLAIVGKRFAPPIGLKSLELHQDELVLHGADSTLIVPVDWVKDATKTERASVYASYHAVVTVQQNPVPSDPKGPATADPAKGKPKSPGLNDTEELLRVLTGPLVEDLRDEIVEIAAVDAALDLLDVLVREGLDQVLAERLGVPLFDRVGDGQADLAHGALVEVDLHGSLTLRLNWRVL